MWISYINNQQNEKSTLYKKTDVVTMKTLLIRVKCIKEKNQRGDNEDRCSKIRRGNKRSGKETETSQLSRNSFLDQLSITKCIVAC